MNKNLQKIDKDRVNVPVMFQKIKDYETKDTRFTAVKIWICHTGLNYNWSIFTKEVLEDAIPTLANTPILGYIETNSEGDEDFSDHRRELDKDTLSLKYKGKAIGVIGETNNAKFEMRLCDDGVEREYLTVEGLLWNKLEDSIDIMNRDIIKSHSVELDESSTGYVNEDDIFVFTNATFYGSCVLGIDHPPAMESSTIELVDRQKIQFAMEEYKQSIDKEISGKVSEFNKHFAKSEEGSGVENMEKEKDDIVETEEVKVKEAETENTEIKSEEVEEVVVDDVKEDVFVKEFKLSHDDIRAEIYRTTDYDFYIVEVFDDEFIAEIYEDDAFSFLKVKYSKTDNSITVDFESAEKVTPQYLNETETLQLEALRLQVSDFEKENQELKNSLSIYQKAEREKAEKELFSKYVELDGIQDYETLKTNVSEYECLDALEKEIALVYVKNKAKLSFTKETKEEDNSIKFDNTPDVADDGYGGLLSKYLK